MIQVLVLLAPLKVQVLEVAVRSLRTPHFGNLRRPQQLLVFARTWTFWVLEGSLGGFFARREAALELVCGGDASCNLMCGAGPSDLWGF